MTSSENIEAKRKVIITGGAGTVGQSFIQQYRNDFEFHNISRNEANIQKLKTRFSEVESHVADIQDLDHLSRLFNKIQPDIVIHTAAFKHVNYAELNPSRTVEVNIVGSLNVAKASIRAGVPIVVGISTDKACQPENIYGYSKKILEQTFLEHYSEQSRFICTRFANVACSSGSVIPFWIKSARSGETLKLTDSRMNRLMFTMSEAAELIRQGIRYAEASAKPFVISRVMKSVGMLELANLISREFGDGSKPEIVGIRPGETLNETLVSQQELPFAYYSDDKRYILLHSDEFGQQRVTEPLSSLTAEYMSETEMSALYTNYAAPAVKAVKLTSTVT